jgi:hypothetical protein
MPVSLPARMLSSTRARPRCRARRLEIEIVGDAMCLLLPADMAASQIGSRRWRTRYGPGTTLFLEVHDLNLGRLVFDWSTSRVTALAALGRAASRPVIQNGCVFPLLPRGCTLRRLRTLPLASNLARGCLGPGM